jgi:hypothetical protein
MKQELLLPRFSTRVGYRYGQEAKVQLHGRILALDAGVDLLKRHSKPVFVGEVKEGRA